MLLVNKQHASYGDNLDVRTIYRARDHLPI